jgi:long-chain acyl-CoA synthetase
VAPKEDGMGDPGAAAVRCGQRVLSYPELDERAARVASGLAEMGLGAGDRVAIVLRNEPTFLELAKGTRLIGAVPVPVNWHWTGSDLEHLLRDSAVTVAFVHSDLLPGLVAVGIDDLKVIDVPVPPEIVTAYRLGHGHSHGAHPDYETWLLRHSPWTGRAVPAPMSMIYTSGTTGRAKGIVRDPTTPEQDQRIAELILGAYRLEPSMRTMVPAPLYHSAPNAHSTMAAAMGADLTIMPRFEAEAFLRLVQENRVEHVQMVPTMFVRLLRLDEQVRRRYDLSSLRAVVHAAAKCPAHVKRAMIDWFGPILHEYYGGSESGIAVTCDTEEWLAHPETVGRPLPGVDLRILGADRRPVAPNEIGEIFIRPSAVWPDFRYTNDESGRRQAIEHDGYWTQGDVGYLDTDGYLYLTDRATDMVISGGVNIYPAEIEQLIQAMAGVRDVAVFGIPDEEYGERLAAHVDVDPNSRIDPSHIQDHVRSRLASYKVPKVVVLDDDLPREESGKLFKRKLRERYHEAYRGSSLSVSPRR